MYKTQILRLLAGLLLIAAAVGPLWAESADDQYALAAGYYAQSRWQEAADEFRAFLQQFPRDRRADLATFFLAEALVQQSRYDQAYTVLDKFLQRYPTHRYIRQALFRHGETAYFTGKDQVARRQLKRFLETYPQDPLCRYVLPYLGDLVMRAGQPAEAMQHYEQALSRFPQGPLAEDCRFGMGRCLEQLGRDIDAQRWYRTVSASATGQLADDALLREAILYYNHRQYGDAVNTLRRLEARFPNSDVLVEAGYWLGQSLMAQGDFAAAAQTLGAAAKEHVDHPLAPAITFAAAEALRKGGDADAAEVHYRRVAEKWPDSQWADDSLQMLAQMALDAGRHESVRQLASELGSRYPDSPLRPLVQLILARSLLQQKQFDKAIELLEREQAALEAADQAVANYLLGLAYLGARQHRKALELLDSLQLPPEQAELAAPVQMARATALMALRKWQDAAVAQRRYLQLAPDGPDAAKCRAELVVALAEAGQLQEAVAAQKELAAQHAGDELVWQTTHFLAERAYQQKQYETARTLYQQLAEADPASPYVDKGLFGLAWVQADTGQTDAALATLKRLRDEHRSSELVPDAAMLEGKLQEAAGRPAEARQAYLLVARHHGDCPRAPQALVAAARLTAAHAELGGKAEAAKLLAEAAERFPELPELDGILYQLAWYYIDLDQKDKAHQLFERLHRQFPQSRYWSDATYRLAAEAASNKQIDRARQLTEALIQSAPAGQIRNHGVYLRGQLAAVEKDWPRVEQLMQQLVESEQSPSLRLPARYWLAEAVYQQGKLDEAESQFASLAGRTEDRRDSWVAMVLLRRAQIMAQKKKWQEAQELADTISSRFPQFPQQYEVDYLLGRCLASRGQFREARQAYERVVRSPTGGRTETAAMAQWMIGESYFHQKRYDEAIRAYHRVETLYAFPRWQSAALLQAGKCYERKGDWASAIKLYAQLLKDYPDSSFAKEATVRLEAAQQKLAAAARRPANRNM